ncbi:MAG: hypothetical protein LW706_11620 [Chitinophagaceae bacterium]|nr:hypothetical protein [Chitinophagaceae bacterium]
MKSSKPLLICSIIILSVFIKTNAQSYAQNLVQKEDSLKYHGNIIVNGEFAEQRFRADSHFTRMLVRALQIPRSFYHPFDSVQTISKLYSPDSMFRIFTWQLSKDENTFRRHGAIQMNTKDSSLKLYPLIDRSSLIINQADTITNNEWWIGAIYYKILLHKIVDRNYYTLLGYDENNRLSTRKIIEILSFDAMNRPVFGSNIFDFSKDKAQKTPQSRYWIEYKKDAQASIKFDQELDLLIYDHLISETNEIDRKETYVPDGDYEAFKWTNGKWLHIEKPFDYKLEDGQAPVIKPVTESKIPVKKSGKKGN